jgi:hypothetical protein
LEGSEMKNGNVAKDRRNLEHLAQHYSVAGIGD